MIKQINFYMNWWCLLPTSTFHFSPSELNRWQKNRKKGIKNFRTSSHPFLSIYVLHLLFNFFFINSYYSEADDSIFFMSLCFVRIICVSLYLLLCPVLPNILKSLHNLWLYCTVLKCRPEAFIYDLLHEYSIFFIHRNKL